MPVPTTPHATTADTNLADALAAVTTEIGRTDGKASSPLASNRAALAGLSPLTGRRLPTPTTALADLAIAALGTATVPLLVVRPSIGGHDDVPGRT